MPKNNIVIDSKTKISTTVENLGEDECYIAFIQPDHMLIPIPFESPEEAKTFLISSLQPKLNDVINKNGKMPFKKACCEAIRKIMQGD